MSKNLYLLDSVILIDHFKQIDQAGKWLRVHGERSQISIVTRMEILSGVDGLDAIKAKEFLGHFPIADLTVEIADFIGSLRYKYRWKLPDAIQAGIAQHYNLKLVTRNTKDFPPDKFSFVMVPY